MKDTSLYDFSIILDYSFIFIMIFFVTLHGKSITQKSNQ